MKELCYVSSGLSRHRLSPVIKYLCHFCHKLQVSMATALTNVVTTVTSNLSFSNRVICYGQRLGRVSVGRYTWKWAAVHSKFTSHYCLLLKSRLFSFAFYSWSWISNPANERFVRPRQSHWECWEPAVESRPQRENHTIPAEWKPLQNISWPGIVSIRKPHCVCILQF